jgi:dTDP-4-amino-4,6-dideoxygalactose transaminase
MGGEELYYVQKVFESNFIAPLGLMVDAFEREFSQKIGIKHGVALSSVTRPCI